MAPESPQYVILGRGRWAQRMQSILSGEGRRSVQIGETRERPGEKEGTYRERLAGELRSSGAQIAWACVLPGPHLPVLVDAALDAGLHIICEKPWCGSRARSESLVARAKSLRRIVAVHYEYCLLSAVERWRTELSATEGLAFGGRFLLSRPNHTGMSALDNLGSHLLSIREYSAPHAVVREIVCGYEQRDERAVWLEKDGQQLAFLDLLEQKEPIIQRFVAAIEAAMPTGEFPLDLRFGVRVNEQVALLAQRSPAGAD